MPPDPVIKRYTERNPFHHLKHIPGQAVTYLMNPKVASTTIEMTLCGAYDARLLSEKALRRCRKRPYVRSSILTREHMDEILASAFISVVRNPYARTLSGYLNKIHRREGWERFKHKFPISTNTPPTFLEFLRVLHDLDPFTVDHHFRPQYINLMHGFAPLDFLGHLEMMDEVRQFFDQNGFHLSPAPGNATHAASRLRQYVGAKEAAIICELHAADFDLYGYSTDPSIIGPVRPPAHLNPDRSLLQSYVEQRLRLRERHHGKMRSR